MTITFRLKALLLYGTIVIGLTSCTQSAQIPKGPPSLEVIWSTPGFKSPESILLSGDTSFLYVSNIDGEGDIRDGNGYISKLGKDGTIIAEKWATGLDAPKGMALNGNKLYVSDIDKLVELDATTGAILQTFPVPEAKFLNDVIFTPDFGVLVSGSATRSLYLYDGNTISQWLSNDLLAGINGLHMDGERILIVTMSGGQLLSLDPASKSLEIIADGMEDADGIKVLKDGSYFVSSWPGQLYHVSQSGNTTLLQDTRKEEIFMNDFELEGDIVYMANFKPGTVQAIKLSQ